MIDLTQSLNKTLGQVLIEQHVTLLDGRPCPIAASEPAAISSGLSCIHVDGGREAFQMRRKRVTLKRGSDHVTLLVRCRPLPEEPENGWLLVEWGRDRLERPVPVCAVEQVTGTIHVLMELGTATVLDTSPGLDPENLLGETFIGEPLSVLLRHAEEPHVGADVRRHVRTLLEKRPRDDRDALESELTLLRRFAPRSALPQALVQRLDALARTLSVPKQKVSDEQVEHEVARLVKLVASRALAAIRVGPDRVEGLINPGALGDEWRLRAAMFRLQLGYTPLHPILQTWSPLRPAPRRGHGHCLGAAQPVLHDMDIEGDIYTLIDTVINFRETNHIQAIPVVESPRQGRRSADWISSMI
jgi:hypothetical protein